jgi:SIR2-like domain/HEAT repeats
MTSKGESPRIPDELLEAVRKKTCVLYAGAGFSLEATVEGGSGFPTGAQLGARLAEELHRDGHLDGEYDPNYAYDFALLAEDYETAFGRNKLIEFLQEIFGVSSEPGRAHELAVKLFPTIITTNFDNLFEDAAILARRKPTVIVRDSQLPFGARTGPVIYKIHGDLRDIDKIVVTARDYQQHPLSEGMRAKLATLLTEQTVLFIGCGDKRVVEALLVAVRDKVSNVRGSAASALGQIGDERAVEAVLVTLKDRDSYVRQNAAYALGQIGDKRAEEGLLVALKDEQKSVCVNAAAALGQIGGERAVEALLVALTDEDGHVRPSAARAIAALSDQAVSLGLVLALASESEFARTKAARAIGYYAPTRETITRLTNIAKNDPSAEGRQAASRSRAQLLNLLKLESA